MNDLKQAEAHTILPVERLGDTLLVLPHGDLGGYSQRMFHGEFERVQALLDDPSLKHVIIDLSGSRYFGSEMLGSLVELRQRVIDRGRAALTDVSPDMQVGLEIIHVDGLFEQFDTRAEAVSALATLTVGQRVLRRRRPMKWGVVLLAVVCVSWAVHTSRVGYQIFGSRTARVYEELAREWTKYDQQSPRWAPEEARTYRASLLNRLASIEQSLRQDRFLVVKENEWLTKSVEQFRSVVQDEFTEDRTAFLESMRMARSYITSRTGLDVRRLGPDSPQGDPPRDSENVEDEDPAVSEQEQELNADALE